MAMNRDEVTIEFETADEIAVFTTRVSSFNSFEQFMGELPIYFNSVQSGCYLLTYSQRNKSLSYIYDEKTFKKMREERPCKIFLNEFTDEVAKSGKFSDIPFVISQEFHQNSEKLPQDYDSLAQKIDTELYPMFNYLLFFSQEELQKLRSSSRSNQGQETRRLIAHESKKNTGKQNSQPDTKKAKALGSDKELLQEIKAKPYTPLSQQFQSFEIPNTSFFDSKKISKKQQEKLQSEVLGRHFKKLFSNYDEYYPTLIKDLYKKRAKKDAALEAEMKILKDCYNEQKKLLQSLSEQNSSQPLKMIDLCDELRNDNQLPKLEKKPSTISTGVGNENKKIRQKSTVQKRRATEPCRQSSEESSSSDSSEERKRIKMIKNKYFKDSDEESDEEEAFPKNGLNSGQGRISQKNQEETQRKINEITSIFPQAKPHQLNQIISKNPSLDIDSIIIEAGLISI